MKWFFGCVFYMLTLGASAQVDGEAIVENARAKLGSRYIKNGHISFQKGIDGVGMVHLLFKEQGIDLPTNLMELYAMEGLAIKSTSLLEKGDLVFFKTWGKEPISEVGIYAGANKVVVVPRSGRKRMKLIQLKTDPIYARAYVLGKRIGTASRKPLVEKKPMKARAKKEEKGSIDKGRGKTEDLGNTIAQYALGKLEIPYQYGGDSWKGVDCSGFTMLVFQATSDLQLPHSARLQHKLPGKRIVKKENLQPGDLLFFETAGNGKITHVGIYIGNNEMVHAPSSGGFTSIANIHDNTYWRKAYRGGLRLH